jgi:hypothetical protein
MARGGMDSLKFHPGHPCPTLLCSVNGPPLKRLHSHFRGGPPGEWATCGHLLPLWTPTPYTYGRHPESQNFLHPLRSLRFSLPSNMLRTTRHNSLKYPLNIIRTTSLLWQTLQPSPRNPDPDLSFITKAPPARLPSSICIPWPFHNHGLHGRITWGFQGGIWSEMVCSLCG